MSSNHDTSILSGKYVWIWQISNDVQTHIAEAKAMGCRGVIVKAGDGGRVWSQFADNVKAFKDAGLVVGGWVYCYGDDVAGEVNAAATALANGAEFLALDVELEYADKAASASAMGTQLRAKCPDAIIAFAPFCFPQNPNFANYPWSPQWGAIPYAQFIPWIDAVLPQVYWSDWPPKCDVGLRTMDAQMKPWGKPIYPVGQTYTSGGFTPSAADYVLFEQTCHELGYTGVSFWRTGTATTDMQASVAKMSFPPVLPPAVVKDEPIDKAAAQAVIDLLGKAWGITSDDKMRKAIHFAADALRAEAGIPTA